MVNNAKDYIKYSSKSSFVSQKIFNNIFVAIHEVKPALTLDKPIYIEFRILDLRKLLVCGCHYNFIKSKFNAN